MIGLTHYLVVGAILFVTGVFGIFVNRKNVIVILMSIELILLAVNINFVAFSTHLGDLAGQVFTMFVLTVAAAEAAIGLAILVVFFRNRGTIGGSLANNDPAADYPAAALEAVGEQALVVEMVEQGVVPEGGPALVHHLGLALRIKILGQLAHDAHHFALPGRQQRCILLDEVEQVLLGLRGVAPATVQP